MTIASAKQLGDHSQQKTKTNLSTCQRTTQFTKRSNFTHKLAAAARLTLCWKYTNWWERYLVLVFLDGILIFRQILIVAACKTE